MKPANNQQHRREGHADRRPASEEPRTGVVRRIEVEPARSRAERAEPAPKSSGAWRCLEWGEPSKRTAPRAPEVSISQLSTGGHVLRQTGPDPWLPDATGFVHRMARLVAQGLGAERCRGVYLRGSAAALSVSEAGPGRVVGVSGPLCRMNNVLRRVGLE